jgi:hypothetical protein
MANLAITRAGQTRTGTVIDDAKAGAFLNDFVSARDGPISGTAAEKADFVLGELEQFIAKVVREYRYHQTVTVVKLSAAATRDTTIWS